MQAPTPQLTFPTSFCCNCGNLSCQGEVQDTRVTRFFGIRGTESTFHLTVPVCVACRKTLRRRPPGFFSILFVLALGVGVPWLLLYSLANPAPEPPSWLDTHRLWISALLGVIVTFVFYRLRRAKPPQTSFYQPVRIKQARVQFGGVMGGPGHVAFLKLAFTNPDYLASFVNANGEAIRGKQVTVVRGGRPRKLPSRPFAPDSCGDSALGLRFNVDGLHSRSGAWTRGEQVPGSGPG